MNARKAIDGKALIYMIGLCAIWGMQQTAVKLAAPWSGPLGSDRWDHND